MKSSINNFNMCVRRWTALLSKSYGVDLEPHVLIISSAIVIAVFQLILYVSFCSQTIYCQLPNLRSIYQAKSSAQDYEKLPTIYVVTPTYARYVQKAELIKLSHTFMLVPNLHWIIVEDSDWRTDMVSKLVRRLKNEFDFHRITHLQQPTPEKFKLKPGDPDWKYPKGVWQRNRALEWLRDNFIDLDRDGVVYFADDDNTYDLEVFKEMRYTRRVSVWPVGFVGGMLVERPLLDQGDMVTSFNSMWRKDRPFPMDMAGFAINLLSIISHSNATFSESEPIGFIESHFLKQFVKSWADLEPKADKCTKILVWHTKTQNPTLHEEKKLKRPSHEGLEW